MNRLFDTQPHFLSGGWLYCLLEERDKLDLMHFYQMPVSSKEAEQMIEMSRIAFRQKKEVILAARRLEDGQLKCLFEIYHVKEEGCEIGYRCRYSEQGKGYTSGSLRGVLEYLKECGFRVVEADAGSIPSEYILKKNGFIKNSSEKAHYVCTI